MNRHFMIRIIAIVAALSLALFASAHHAGADARASAVTRAVFYSGHPQQGGEVIAELDAHAAASARFEDAEFVVLQGADFAYTFAVSQGAEAEQGVLVALQHAEDASASATLAISEVIARLDAALRGDAEVGIFTSGESDGGVVVAIHDLDDDSTDTQVEVDVDTRNVADSETRVGAHESGTEAKTDGRAEAGAEANASGEARANTETNAETDAEVGVGVDVDMDVDTDAEAEGEAEGNVEDDTNSDTSTEGRSGSSASTTVEVGVGIGLGGGDDDSDDSN